ncbi:MAG: SCO family protein, partial [Acetobacteraceae bacterium]
MTPPRNPLKNATGAPAKEGRGAGRRRAGGWIVGLGLLATLAFAHPARAAHWHGIDVRGSAASLAFGGIDAQTGKPLRAADLRGKVVLLYLGYTNCPDVC